MKNIFFFFLSAFLTQVVLAKEPAYTDYFCNEVPIHTAGQEIYQIDHPISVTLRAYQSAKPFEAAALSIEKTVARHLRIPATFYLQTLEASQAEALIGRRYSQDTAVIHYLAQLNVARGHVSVLISKVGSQIDLRISNQGKLEYYANFKSCRPLKSDR